MGSGLLQGLLSCIPQASLSWSAQQLLCSWTSGRASNKKRRRGGEVTVKIRSKLWASRIYQAILIPRVVEKGQGVRQKKYKKGAKKTEDDEPFTSTGTSAKRAPNFQKDKDRPHQRCMRGNPMRKPWVASSRLNAAFAAELPWFKLSVMPFMQVSATANRRCN